MEPIKVGSVGIGAISRHVHLPGIARSKDLQLVAVCDIDPEALQYAQENYGIDEAHCFTNYHDLINCPDVEAVDIATPNDVHYEVALAAAEAGKPYAVEKPLVMNSAQADHLAEITKKNHVKSMVCFSYRFKAAARYARDLIQRGMLGTLYHADMQYYQAWALPHCDTPLKWRFVKEHTGSGTLGDLGSHALDLVRFVTGKDYVRLVSHADTFITEREKEDGTGLGKVDVDDYANCMAVMDGGTSVTIRVTRYGYGRGNYQTLEIYGSEGAIQYELDHTTPDVDEIAICIGKANAEAHTFTKVPIPNHYKADQMQSFADIIRNRADGFSATIFDGQINQHAMDAVLESADSGKWINLKEEEES